MNGNCYNVQTYDDLIPLFYIGMKDRNGQKIYDGDKVIFEVIDDNYLSKTVTMQGVIEWDSYDCCYVINVDPEYNWPVIFLRYVTQIEVIGNIYEIW